LRSDYALNLIRYIFHAERLLDKPVAAPVYDIGGSSFNAVAAGQENGDGWIYLS